jgi:hypothetical protein
MTTTVTTAPDDAVQTSTTKASGAPRRWRAGDVAVLAIAAALMIFGAASIVKGLDGRSTVRAALAQEQVVGSPHMTPAGIKAKVSEAGLRDVSLPSCSVAGKRVVDGTSARCFAEYMRVDALTGTGGATYAEMPRFATDDGKGTNDPAEAQRGPNGQPVDNPARRVWITATALSTALNTSYMAEQISLFGIAVGSAFLLIGLASAAVLTARRRKSPAAAHATQA